MKLLKKTVTSVQKTEEHDVFGDGRYTLILTGHDEDTPLAAEYPAEEGLIEVSAVFPFAFEEDDVFFLNGYQSWTYSPERTRKQFDDSLRYCPKALDKKFGFSQYGDGYFSDAVYRRDLRSGYKKGYSYAYVRRGETFFLFASLAEDTGFTRIEMLPDESVVRFKKDCHHRRLAEGEEYTALDLIFLKGSEDFVFGRWFAEMGVAPMATEPKTGYTSWYNCYQDISEAQILKDLEGMKTLPVKPDIFQIDDGFETFVGDWLSVDPVKFPNGLGPIAEKIKEEGYQPGIWLAPFVCEMNSALLEAHPEWLQYRDDKPVFTGANWSGGYALDPYNEEVRDYVRRCIGHYKDMGFTLFKLDFLYAACMTSRPDKTRGEIMADAMEFLREVCGDAQILACGVPLASAFGRVEYCRIGPDMSLSYNDKLFMRLFHNERPSTMHTQRNTLYRRQLDKRAFLNDPDVFLLREGNTSLSAGQKETLAVVNALFGSVLFASDDFAEYDEEKKELYARLTRLQHAKQVKTTVEHLGRKHLVTVSYLLDDCEERLELEL